MKRIFTFLFGFLCVLALNAQSVNPLDWNGELVADFDGNGPADVTSWGGLNFSYAPAPAGSPASGQMLVVDCPANNQGPSFTIVMNSAMYDPHDYVGVSFLCQSDYTENQIPFVLKLETSQDDNNQHQAQDWDTYAGYNDNGAGGWQQVRLPFAVCLAWIDANHPDWNISNMYDRLELQPAAYKNYPEFIVNLDDFMLRYDWDEPDDTGIPLTKLAAFIISSDGNGAISAKGFNGNQVSLKVYSATGQEVIEGVNNVQIGTKGVYIVKATDGKTTDTQKVVVR